MASTFPVSAQAPIQRQTAAYADQRDALEAYFDGTARKAWEDLTSDAKVSGIRATVRAGRDRMRSLLLDWLPADLRRTRILDAGCGTGALAIEAARRGADVVAIDVAAGLIDVARDRAPSFLGHGSIEWHVGDMLDPRLGHFDHVVAMDSLIHYSVDEIVGMVSRLGERTAASMLFTVAPRTRALTAMHAVGRLFPRSDRAPAIQPVAAARLSDGLAGLAGWSAGRTDTVASGFYTSRACELVRD